MAAKREILSLTALRGIAAFWVLLFHLRRVMNSFTPDLLEAVEGVVKSGYLGVDLFFVLSGYVITMNYGDAFARLERDRYARFIVKRLARIYPVYLFGLFLAVITLIEGKITGYALKPGEWTIDGFIQSLLMVQGWTYPIQRHWNIIAWSVSVEWLAYLLFPLFAWMAWKVKNRKWAALALLLVVHVAYAALVMNIPRLSGMRIGLLRLLVGFTSGTLLWRIRENEERGGVGWSLLGVALVLGTGKLWMLSMGAKVEPLAWASLYFTLCIYFVARGADGPLGFGPLVHLGHISYALYVVHGRVLTFVRQAIPTDEFAKNSLGPKLGYMIGVTAFAVLLAHLVHTYIEKPARKWIVERWAGDS